MCWILQGKPTSFPNENWAFLGSQSLKGYSRYFLVIKLVGKSFIHVHWEKISYCKCLPKRPKKSPTNPTKNEVSNILAPSQLTERDAFRLVPWYIFDGKTATIYNKFLPVLGPWYWSASLMIAKGFLSCQGQLQRRRRGQLGALYYRPKQCTFTRGIPQNYLSFAFALFGPSLNDPWTTGYQTVGPNFGPPGPSGVLYCVWPSQKLWKSFELVLDTASCWSQLRAGLEMTVESEGHCVSSYV